jgi:hypothetical protein
MRVIDPVHGIVKVSPRHLEMLQSLPREWTPIRESRMSKEDSRDLQGHYINPVALRAMTKYRWAETEWRKTKLFARKTELGASVRRAEDREGA